MDPIPSNADSDNHADSDADVHSNSCRNIELASDNHNDAYTIISFILKPPGRRLEYDLQRSMAMTIYDISLTISPNLPTWPGDPALELEQIQSMSQGAPVNVTRINTSVHIGTHIDAPRHFFNNGATIEQLPLDVLTGPCYVAQLPDGIEAITAEVLDRMESLQR
jgi:hypothetical protein